MSFSFTHRGALRPIRSDEEHKIIIKQLELFWNLRLSASASSLFRQVSIKNENQLQGTKRMKEKEGKLVRTGHARATTVTLTRSEQVTGTVLLTITRHSHARGSVTRNDGIALGAVLL